MDACLSTGGDLHVIDLSATYADSDRYRTAADFAVDDKLRTAFARIEGCFKVFATMRTGDGDEVLHPSEIVVFIDLPQRFFEGDQETIQLVLGNNERVFDAQDTGVDVGAADENLV